MNFTIGQTFNNTYPPEAAVWCNTHNAYITKQGNQYIIVPVPGLTLEDKKSQKILQIDSETSAAIIAGFDYEIDGVTYHFSYDAFDQQNFSDTANMCQLALANPEGLPSSVVWNSYLPDGTLVQQTFEAKSFLTLYTDGAMQHKLLQMSKGGQRKAKVQSATTIEEVEAA